MRANNQSTESADGAVAWTLELIGILMYDEIKKKKNKKIK